LKANYLYVFAKIFLIIAIIVSIKMLVVPYCLGKNIYLGKSLFVIISLGSFSGVFSSIIFTPLEISWNKESFSIQKMFSGTKEFSWNQLEGYHTTNWYFNCLKIRFQGQRTFEILSFGFSKAEWQEFQLMLKTQFPEKMKSQWFLL
jgi:hypothetical protein